jgi:hypothetical protein
MADVVFDKQDQLERVQSALTDGEQLIGVYDGKGIGTGFLGITDKRLIFQDNSFVGGKSALTSIPFSRVSAVSFVADKSMFGKLASSSTVNVHVGSKDYEIEFRGADKAKHAHDVILWGMLHKS